MYKIVKSTDNGLDEIELDQLEKGYWLDIVAPSEDELTEIAAATGIQMDFLSAALDEEEKSRIEVEDDQILILVDIPFFRSNKDYDTLPLGIIITENGITTVCLEANGVTADFGTHNARLFSTFKKTRFLFQILYKSATLYLKYIRIIIKRTDELEIHLRQSMENSELFNLLDLQKSLTYFSTSLRSNSIVMERLLRLRNANANTSQHLIKVYEEDEDLLDDVIIEYKQAVEMVEMYSHILNSMMEVFASIISNNLNLVMKFLASVTILLAIPTLISGLWGMNVHVPFADSPYGFAIVVCLAFVVAIGSALFLWKRRMF
ncbi:MAG: magnesium transporter CorA family protein [Phascolarctobacterium sp.]|nr:magnesium transporter CorA family protein [Phascolarctobacterium sp.]